MAQIVEGGSHMFDALAYGQTLHPGTQQFLQHQVERPTEALTDAGRGFLSGVQQLYDRLSGSTAMRIARAAKRAAGSIWQSDEIRYLASIGEMQHAPLVMQRYILAHPYIRKLYQEQRIEGYSGSYRDPFPEDRGENHYDYRRVMSGVVEEDDDGGWSATTYYDELLPDDYDLSLEEQVDIIDTQENVIAAIKKGGEDPTSRWNADI